MVAPRHILDSDFNRVHSGAALRRGYTDLHGFFERVVSAIKTGPERNFIYAYWPELDRL
ncbi:MAG: phosphodiesterase, partial [Gammaproteobacteria bacterium]|nr:phosphodiesterase [Gammaproteobacteria bacterium]NIX88534.1 phosphodiesterase [Gammaproteobacteria bacterium]